MPNDKKQTDLGKPLDPTTDPQDFLGDTSGRTGVTITTNNAPADSRKAILKRDQTNDTTRGVIDPNSGRVNKKIQEQKQRGPVAGAKTMELDELQEPGDKLINEATPPHSKGEQSVSGSAPAPQADDDTLRNSHQVGLRLDEDEENPKPLDIAGDVAAAEKRRREK